jgi:hypothetical protein
MVNGDSTGTALTNSGKESYDQCSQRKKPGCKTGLIRYFKSGREDLNLRPPAPKAAYNNLSYWLSVG